MKLLNKKSGILVSILSLCLLLGVTQFSSNRTSTELGITTIPEDFVYDGCSRFPDGDYGDCCKTHDDAYFFGGSWQERLTADYALAACVSSKEGWYHKPLGPIMWMGVRIGGAPIWPTSFRWGFGRDLYN